MGRRLWLVTVPLVVVGAACRATSHAASPAASGASATSGASAVVGRSGPIEIVDPFVPVPSSPAVAAFYVTLRNGGATADALVSATSAVAASSTLHSETTTKSGVEAMTDLPQLALPPHGSASLAPGQDHLMLMGLHQTLRVGQRVAVTLRFAHAGPITIEAPVVPLSQVVDGMSDGGGNMGNMNMAGMGGS